MHNLVFCIFQYSLKKNKEHIAETKDMTQLMELQKEHTELLSLMIWFINNEVLISLGLLSKTRNVE